MGLRDKLASLLPTGGVLFGKPGAQPSRLVGSFDELSRRGATSVSSPPDAPPLPFSELRPWVREKTRFGLAWEHAETLSASYTHGRVPLQLALDLPGDALDVLCADERLRGFDVRRALFLDIEATGLSHGAGTLAFLIGLGHFDAEGRFVVRQLVLDSPENEMAQLAHFKRILEGFDFLVSFNGKSYDLSVLQTRLIVQKFYSPTEGELKLTPHLDLLHIHRAVWKSSLPDCRLQTLERHVMGVEREGDVSGELIPSLYFSYLQRSDAQSLDPVLVHNRLDVISMAALVGDLLRSIHRPQTCSEPKRLLGLAGLHVRRGLHHRALQIVEQALVLGLDGDDQREAFQLSLRAHRRLGEDHRMFPVLEAWRERFPDDVDPWVELAKHHEHRMKDYEEALTCAWRAKALLLPWQKGEHEAIGRRVARLRSRVTRKNAASSPP